MSRLPCAIGEHCTVALKSLGQSAPGARYCGRIKANPSWPLLADVCVLLQEVKDLDLTKKSCFWLSKFFKLYSDLSAWLCRRLQWPISLLTTCSSRSSPAGPAKGIPMGPQIKKIRSHCLQTYLFTSSRDNNYWTSVSPHPIWYFYTLCRSWNKVNIIRFVSH